MMHGKTKPAMHKVQRAGQHYLPLGDFSASGTGHNDFFSQNGKHFSALQRFRTFGCGAVHLALYFQARAPLHQPKSLYPSN